MTHPAFEDRVVALSNGGEALARLAAVLGSPTRVAVLQALVASRELVDVQRLARRVGVDASPVRTHLELLVKEGLVREVEVRGRERRFETRLRDVRLVLVGVNRAAAPEKAAGAPPKSVVRLERKLAGLAKDMVKLEAAAARLARERDEAWRQAAGQHP